MSWGCKTAPSQVCYECHRDRVKAFDRSSARGPFRSTLALPTPGAFSSLITGDLPERRTVLCAFAHVLPSAQGARPSGFFKQAGPLQPLRPSSNDTSSGKPSLSLPPSLGVRDGSVLHSPTFIPILPCRVIISLVMVLSSLDGCPSPHGDCVLGSSLGPRAWPGVRTGWGPRPRLDKTPARAHEGPRGTRGIRTEYTVPSLQLNKSPNPDVQKGNLFLSTAIDRPKCTHRQMFV